ncbi:RNA ligase [Amycolatopsis lexingtonensis]|uniref:RNA ligase n=1 Tax=Amycolatopsis lexingtonensis TaxID=218822 RepID=UPI003F6EAA25
MHLYDLVPEDEIVEALEAKLVRRQDHPYLRYSILNYTDKAQVNNIWTRATKTLRGVIFDRQTLQVIARPFPKFFNYGQEPAKHRRWRPDEQVIVTDKLDGSLGILYPDPVAAARRAGAAGYAIATRGSFTSDQAVHATELLRSKYPDFVPYPGKTYLFEIIYPENRIVVNYDGLDDIVLLGVVDIRTGISYDVGPESPYSAWDWPGLFVHRAPYVRLRDALAAAPRPGKEGMVVHFLESDERVKLKQDDYVALHKIVTGLDARVVWEAVQEKGALDALLESLPDEFHEWVKETASELYREWFRLDWEVEATFAALEEARVVDDRKAFALSIQNKPAWLKAALFAFLDRNYSRVQSTIWKNLKPKGDK